TPTPTPFPYTTLFRSARKAGKYDKELVKEFVDHCFATYKPSAKYPGLNFGFMATYMTREFQAVQKAYSQRKKDEEEATEPIEDRSEEHTSELQSRFDL